MSMHPTVEPPAASWIDDDGARGTALLRALASRWKLLIGGAIACGVVAVALSFAVTPTFTARTSFLPPQQQQSSAASALASLGALSGLAGAAGMNVRTPADQYVSLLQSATVSDRMVEQFKLMDVYGTRFRFEAREALGQRVRITIGKKDGLIFVEVDDHEPRRAAEMANRYVEELRRISAGLALTEAQQRRVFFERELQQTRDRLTTAQQALQASGFTEGTLRAEPKAAAEGYAQLRAELTAAEVRLQGLRRSLADNTPEVQQQQAVAVALRGQLARAESALPGATGADYAGRYREFKYQEALFELLARQYESARIDESREGALIQVIDVAMEPEWKSKPKRATWGVLGTALGFLALCLLVAARHIFSARPMREAASH